MTRDVATGGEVLLVEIGGRLAVLCAAEALDADLHVVIVPNAEEAVRRIAKKPPRVVVVPGTIDARARREIASRSRDAGAALVELPSVVDEDGIAHAMARGIRASSVEEAPITQRSNVESFRAAR